MDNAVPLALLLIAVGMILLAAELFLQTFGVLFAVGIGAIIVGVSLSFYYGDSSTGFLTLISVFIAVPLFLVAAFQVWQRSPIGRHLIKSGPDEDATIATMPVNVELEQLRGRFGQTVSSLRPSGVATFDGRRIDVMSEGMMIDPDTWVRCIDVKAGRVIVRAAERPSLDDLENTDFS